MQRPTSNGEAIVGEGQGYDPEGTAAAWVEAAGMILDMRLTDPPRIEDAWNTALEQAARTLETQASRIKQASGMYYRPLTGVADDGSGAAASQTQSSRIRRDP
jgi:hypothetical protein